MAEKQRASSCSPIRRKKMDMSWYRKSLVEEGGVDGGGGDNRAIDDRTESLLGTLEYDASIIRPERKHAVDWNEAASRIKTGPRLNGRLSWDTNVLENSGKNWQRPKSYKPRKELDPIVANLIAKHRANTNPEALSVTLASEFQFTKVSPDDENHVYYEDDSDMMTKDSKTEDIDESSDEEDDDGSSLSKETRDKYFGPVAKSNFYSVHKSLYTAQQNFKKETSESVKSSSDLFTESASSPRQSYLSGCYTQSLVPLPLVIRKRATTVFDFSHQGLGDAAVIQFSNALRDMPYVEEINICDNRLSDKGCNALLSAVFHKPNLSKLNISMNEVGTETSKTLHKYLSSPMCTIEEFILEKADIDDIEAAAFMVAFEKNKSVTTLNLSRNKIGQLEVLNVVQPDFVTGGEALGSMLNINLTLSRLNLSWNLIRLESAVTLAKSLVLNYSLIELNLSYNAAGDEGAMAFGSALETNSTLRQLDLSYNNIGLKGALVLACSISSWNSCLRVLKLNGNNIGKEGGKAMMLLMAESSASSSEHEDCVGVDVEMNGCNLSSSSSSNIDNAFDAREPSGKYKLDMTLPYDRMIATELFRLAATRTGCRFTSIAHDKKTIKLVKPLRKDISPVNVMFKDIDRDGSGAIDAPELVTVLTDLGLNTTLDVVNSLIKEFDTDGDGSIDDEEFSGFFYHAVFSIIDVDKSGALDASELSDALSNLGIVPTHEREVEEIIQLYDTDGSGSIEKAEFVEFMETRALEVAATERASKIRKSKLEDTNFSTALLDAESMTKFVLPTEGFLHVTFVAERSSANAANHTAITPIPEGKNTVAHTTSLTIANATAASVAHLVRNIKVRGKDEESREALLSVAIEDSDITYSSSQAIEILNSVSTKSNCKIRAAVKILPQLASVREVHKFLSSYLTSVSQRLEVRKVLGPAMYGVVSGAPTRAYVLDLRSASDRAAAIKLAEFAYEERQFSKKRSGRADTSQKGNWENFRNETLNGKPIVLTGGFFNNLPSTGLLEFDYVSTTRPTRGTKAISDKRFRNLMEVLKTKTEHPKTNNNMTNAGRRNAVNPLVYLDSTFEILRTSVGVETKLAEIEILVGNRWLTTEQALEIIICMPKTDQFNSRVEVCRLLFSRVLDIENFVDIYDSGLCSADDQRLLISKLGILNIMNPQKPDRFYELNLAIKEERDLCKILVALAVEEPGENWIDESYQWSKEEGPVPGWELPASWAKEDDGGASTGPRRTGFLSLKYYSGADLGCAPVWPLRKELMAKVLCGTRLYL